MRQVRRLLDAPPSPEVSVNLAQLYHQAAARQQRHLQRWRRAAVLFFGAAAALVALALVPRLEVRLDGHQFVLRWANPPLAEIPAPLAARVHAGQGDRSEPCRSATTD